jgi:hypothetical protein
MLWLLAIVALLGFTFWHNQQCLSAGLDGTWYRVMLGYEAIDRPAFAQTGVDALSGSFDAYYPLQREYLLPSALSLLFADRVPGVAMTYFVYGIFLVLAIYAVGRAAGFERPIALAAGFLMTILAPPGLINYPSQLYHLFELNPHWSETTGLGLLIVAALWSLDGRGNVRTTALAVAPTLCLCLAVLAVAPQVIFMVPMVAIYGAGSLFAVESWRDDRWRIAAGALMLAVPLLLGVAAYYFALIDYTAYRFFPAEIGHPLGGKVGLSSLFGYWSLGRWTIILGVVGATWSLLTMRGKPRLLGATHLAATGLFFLLGWWFAFRATDYRGSFPVYFEIGLWPYALLFAVSALVSAARLLLRVGDSLLGGVLARASGGSASLVLTAILASVAAFNAVAASHPQLDCHGWSTPPVRPTAITAYLARMTALAPGARFNGMVATLDGLPPDKPADWVKMADRDHRLWEESGNDHRSAGLWRFNIPTLFQYDTFITPPYYLLLTDFLASPQDHQLRSSIVMSRLDAPIMELWGVRYLITDFDTEPGKTVVELPTKDLGTLRLIELPDANLGGYSPTQVRQADDFRSGLQIMHDPGFDGRRQVVTEAAIDGALVPSTGARLVYERDGFHLTADSPGQSVLVLPIQYSHCWTVSGRGAPSLFRADLMQLGVRFNGALDAQLVFRFGPILASGCRVEDLRDMSRLDIRHARSEAWRAAINRG